MGFVFLKKFSLLVKAENIINNFVAKTKICITASNHLQHLFFFILKNKPTSLESVELAQVD